MNLSRFNECGIEKSTVFPAPAGYPAGIFSENGRAAPNKLPSEVMAMLAAVWLMFSTLLYSLQLNTGTFPKPLTEKEEQHYLALAAQGDIEARNILIERNLRLVAHIMKKY